MEQTILDTLTRPFTPEQIRQREGRGGTRLDYLETHSVITRLNEAFAGAWSFEVEVLAFPPTDGTEVLVLGKLTAGGVTKTQFGSSEIARRKGQNGEQGAPVSIGDDLKSAGSDALKKCATLFGIGLHLYDKPQAARQPAQQRPASQADRRPGPGQTTQQRPVNGPARSGSGPAQRQPGSVNGTARAYGQRTAP